MFLSQTSLLYLVFILRFSFTAAALKKKKKRRSKKKTGEEGSDDEGFDDAMDEDIEETINLSTPATQEPIGDILDWLFICQRTATTKNN